MVPQLPQLFSTRRPDWNFIDSARLVEAVVSNSLAEATLTTTAVLFLFVSLRVADTTTASIESVSSLISKFTSTLLPLRATIVCFAAL